MADTSANGESFVASPLFLPDNFANFLSPFFIPPKKTNLTHVIISKNSPDNGPKKRNIYPSILSSPPLRANKTETFHQYSILSTIFSSNPPIFPKNFHVTDLTKPPPLQNLQTVF